jgi:hypothetical protein
MSFRPHANGMVRQDLGQWVKNNWRAERIMRTTDDGRKKSNVDFAWATMPDRVDAVLLEMWEARADVAGESELTFSAFSFQQRNAAAKKLIDRLGDDEKAALEKMVETQEMPEVSPEVKQE